MAIPENQNQKITKISVYNLPTLSWDNSERHKQMTDAPRELATMADKMQRIARIVSFVNQYPYIDVEVSIRTHTTENVSITQKTKRVKTYSIHYLTITVETTD